LQLPGTLLQLFATFITSLEELLLLLLPPPLLLLLLPPLLLLLLLLLLLSLFSGTSPSFASCMPFSTNRRWEDLDTVVPS
jgi:hypothetical protein